MTLDLEACERAIEAGARPFYRGYVDIVSGVLVEAVGVPAAIGELCRIRRADGEDIEADVVGFRGDRTLLMPHGNLDGIGPRRPVVPLHHPFSVPVGSFLLGRVVDGFGRPLDGGPALPCRHRALVRGGAPEPMSRAPIREPLQTGVRAIDALTTVGRGQRLGIFSGSGVGKSSLLSQMTRGTDADVIVVGLIGERGREVRPFVDDVLEGARDRATVVVATSDRPPIERYMAPFVAVTAAEHFRAQGLNVLLVMDSITRFATACREIGLAAGEPPTVRGYPPSFFATVPQLVERMGSDERGSITGLLTVLLDADDPNDPVSDTMRGLLDGHLFLDRDLAQRGHFPAIDVLRSLSRLMPSLIDEDHAAQAARLRSMLAAHREGRDLVEIGAYKPGTNRALDEALILAPAIEAFLQQRPNELTPLDETKGMLARLIQAVGEIA